jgi:hypothetical protein
MKKQSKILVACLLVLVMGLGMGTGALTNNFLGRSKNPANPNPSGSKLPDTTAVAASSTRYLTTPVEADNGHGGTQNYELVHSYTDGDFDFHYIYLGKVDWVPIDSHGAQHFNGRTPIKLTYSVTEQSSGGVETALERAVTNATETVNGTAWSLSAEGQANFGIIKKVSPVPRVSVKVGYTHNWHKSKTHTEEQSKTDTVTTFSNWAKENTQTIEFTIGNHGEAAGFYRYATFATCDVYVGVIRDRDTEEWYFDYAMFARNNTFFMGLDYSTTNVFGINEETLPLRFDDEILSFIDPLPEPAERPDQFTVFFVVGGVTVKTETVSSGSFATPPANPVSLMQNFAGWGANVNATPIVANRTFTAQWVDKQWVTRYEASNQSQGITVRQNLPLNMASLIGQYAHGTLAQVTFRHSSSIVNTATTELILFNSGNFSMIVYVTSSTFNYTYTFSNGVLTTNNNNSALSVIKIQYFQ